MQLRVLGFRFLQLLTGRERSHLLTTISTGAIVQFNEVFPEVGYFGGTHDLGVRADDSAEREGVVFEVEESGGRHSSE